MHRFTHFANFFSWTKTLGLSLCLMGFGFAHVTGGALELYHGIQGEYELWVSSRQSAPVSGAHHLTVTVLSVHDKQAVPDARVNLTLASPGRAVRTYRAVPTTRPYAFEVDAPLEQPGRWRITLDVQSPSGDEKATFSLRIFRPSQLWLLPLSVFAASAALMALLGFGTFSLSADRRKRVVGRSA